MAMPVADPITLAPRARRQVWSLGGGKGGIGKSLLTASLGWQLARMGKRVVLVDADLGGANLHTCLGLAAPGAHAGRLHPAAGGAHRGRSRGDARSRAAPGERGLRLPGRREHQAPTEGAGPEQGSLAGRGRGPAGPGRGNLVQHHRLLPDLRGFPSHRDTRAHLDRERLPVHQERPLPPAAGSRGAGLRAGTSWTRPSIPRTPSASGHPWS